MAKEQNVKSFDAKAMIAEHAAKGTKVKYAERLPVEIVAETKHYKVGDKINPHKIMGQALIDQGIAKAVKLLIIGLLMFGLGQSAKAQDFAGQIGTTVTHATVGADTTNVTIAKSRTAINFKYDITKNSGTVAGTIVLQGKITAAASAEQWSTINTYTLTDATTSTVVSLTANQFVNYRIIYTTTGTSSTTRKLYLLYRGYYPLQ